MLSEAASTNARQSYKHKAVVLLSSGLDSTVNLFSAVLKFDVVRVLTFNYGQKSALKEIEKSRKICEYLCERDKDIKLTHQVIELPWLKHITNTALVNPEAQIPQNEDVKIDDYEQSLITAQAVWVPNRNGIFLNIAASFAESLGAKYVIPGFNKEEATTFPDNSVEYMAALEASFSFSTANHVEVFCFTSEMNKSEIVKLGRQLKTPFEMLWPCYFSGEKICGQCESCSRFLRAIES